MSNSSTSIFDVSENDTFDAPSPLSEMVFQDFSLDKSFSFIFLDLSALSVLFFCSGRSGYSIGSVIGESFGGNLGKPILPSFGEEKKLILLTGSSTEEFSFLDFSLSEIGGVGGVLDFDPPPLAKITLFPRYSSFFYL